MLTTYFTRERTRATYAAGPTGPYLDDFSQWLEKRGFTTRTIRRCLFGATQFAAWADAAGIPVPCLDATTLEAFRGYLALQQVGRDRAQIRLSALSQRLLTLGVKAGQRRAHRARVAPK